MMKEYKILIILLVTFLCGCDVANNIYVDLKDKISPPVFDRKLNQSHQFEIKGCDIFYNGKRLEFKTSISEWVEVLGPYSREPSAIRELYVWDDLGLAVRVRYDTELVSSIEWRYRINNNYSNSLEYVSNPKNYVDGEEGAKRGLETRNAWPSGRFKDAIIVDGLLMDDQFNLEELNQSRVNVGLDPFIQSNYRNRWIVFKKCRNAQFKFTITLNEKNPSKVNNLYFSDLRKY